MRQLFFTAYLTKFPKSLELLSTSCLVSLIAAQNQSHVGRHPVTVGKQGIFVMASQCLNHEWRSETVPFLCTQLKRCERDWLLRPEPKTENGAGFVAKFANAFCKSLNEHSSENILAICQGFHATKLTSHTRSNIRYQHCGHVDPTTVLCCPRNLSFPSGKGHCDQFFPIFSA